MRKEVLFAIIFGTLFGLVIAFGVWRLNSSISPKTDAKDEDTQPKPTDSPQNSFGVTIAKPGDLTVHSEDKVKISGATEGDSWIIVSGEAEDIIEKAKSDGAFEIEIDLAGGLNQIIIYSEDKEGNSAQKSLNLVYSSQFPQASAEPEPSQATDSVREKVEDKVRKSQNPAIFYMGTITDISKLSLNLKNTSDQIEQVSIEDEASLSNETTKKEIKATDLAIGDFVIAMGYRNGNQVLSAKRVVVTKKPTANPRKILVGSVKGIENKILTLSQKSENIELTFPKRWDGPDTKEIEEGSLVAVVANSESKDNIRTIEILQ